MSRSLRLRPIIRRRDDPLDRLSAELVKIDDCWVRIHRKAYDDGTLGDRFPGLPLQAEHGEPSKPGAPTNAVPTFVLIHGIGVSSRYFVNLAEDLCRIGDVFLLDLPGFATLPHPRRPLSIASFAAIVHRVLVNHGVRNPVMLGHSMGAQVVTELLAQCPGYADRAILIGPPVNDRERTLTRQLIRFTQSSLYENRRLRLIAVRAYLQCGVTWFFDILPHMMGYPIEDRIQQVAEPVLLVRGEYDYVCPTPWLGRLGAENPHVVAGAAHCVIWAHDDDVFRLIRDFL